MVSVFFYVLEISFREVSLVWGICRHLFGETGLMFAFDPNVNFCS